MAEYELDLNSRPSLTKPELTLDLTQPHYQQTDFVEVFEPSTVLGTGFPHPCGNDDTAPLLQEGKPIIEWTEEDWAFYEQQNAKPQPLANQTRTDAQLPSIQEFTVAKLAEQYGYRGNLTVGALQDDIVFRVKRSALDALEAGKALILLKEVAGHGNYLKCLEVMEFTARTAQRYVKVAEKFGKSDTMSHLVMTVKDANKILAMVYFDDDELETIAQGGDIDGINLETIKSLSAPKLKKLIQSRVEAETKATLEKVEAEKKALADDVASLSKQVENHEKHYSELQAKHELTERQLKQLTEKRSSQKYNATTLMIREEASVAEYGVRIHVDELKALFSQYLTSTDTTPDDQAAREHALALAVGGICSEVLELYQAVTSVIELPELTGQFAMTDEELKRLNDCRLMLDHTYLNDKTARELRREEKSRKGRPMGSNKD